METELTVKGMFSLLEDEPKVEKPRVNAALAAFRNLCAGAEVAQKHANDVFGAMPTILELVDVIDTHLDEAEVICEEVNIKWKLVAERLKTGIKARLTSDALGMRRAVCSPLLRHKLNVLDAGEGTATVLLDWMVQEKFLTPDDSGFALFRGEKFAMSKEFGLTENDIAELKSLVATLCKKAKSAKPKLVKQPAQISAPVPQNLKSNEPITAGEAWWDGKLGKFSLLIPPANGHDKGGVLELEAQAGGFLFVEKASVGFGHLENASIPWSAIKASDGTIRRDLRLPEPVLEPEKLAKWQMQMEFLFRALSRGFARALTVCHDMAPAEFLATDLAGDSVIKFDGTFNWKPASNPTDWAGFKDLTLRFSRRHDGAIALVEILSPEAKSRLECELGKYYKHGFAFSGLPLFLMLFLKASYGQVVQKR